MFEFSIIQSSDECFQIFNDVNIFAFFLQKLLGNL